MKPSIPSHLPQTMKGGNGVCKVEELKPEVNVKANPTPQSPVVITSPHPNLTEVAQL